MSDLYYNSEQNSSRQLKVNISEKIANNLKSMSKSLGISQSQIVEDSIRQLFESSHLWNMRKIFLEKTGEAIPAKDLHNLSSNNSVIVACKSEEQSAVPIFFTASVINIDSNEMVTIQLTGLANHPISSYKVCTSDDALVIPTIADLPYDYSLRTSTLYSLHTYRYTIDPKYLWNILNIPLDQFSSCLVPPSTNF